MRPPIAFYTEVNLKCIKLEVRIAFSEYVDVHLMSPGIGIS